MTSHERINVRPSEAYGTTNVPTTNEVAIAGVRGYHFSMNAGSVATHKSDPGTTLLGGTTNEDGAQLTSSVEGEGGRGAGTAFGTLNTQQSSVDGTGLLQRISASSSALETASKLALLGSAALYGIGLLIANFNSHLYARPSLGLNEAQYVLVGTLWAALTLFGFALARTGTRLAKSRGPWRDRPLKEDVKNALLVALGWAGLLGFFVYAISSLVDNIWVSLAAAGVVAATDAVLAMLYEDVRHAAKSRSEGSDSSQFNLWEAAPRSVAISFRVLLFLMALSLYATFVFPNIPLATGGGKLHRAEIFIRQDRRSLFDSMAGFKTDKVGKLGPVCIVAESEESIIIIAPSKQWWKVWGSPSLRLKKELVELVIYTD